MNKIEILYNKYATTPSEINEHLPTLQKYCSECSHITEFGVRTGMSTTAFLSAPPKKLISYDIEINDDVINLINLSKEYNIDFTFNQKSTLEIEIEPTDLLFIDTKHNYTQLKEELRLHADKSRKYIIFHDTVSFGYKPKVPDEENFGKGLIHVISEFLSEHKEWEIYEHFTNNNGLMILKRKSRIKIFVRHCNFSSNSVGKNKPQWFSREKCWINLKQTSDEYTDITVLFDGEPNNEHFLSKDKEGYTLVCRKGGNDGKSFLNLLEYVNEQEFDCNTILYFLEDDYYHRPGWTDIMREAFKYIGSEYVTLYDHKDKYFLPMYSKLNSKIMISPSSHWRNTPSTTNTYAMMATTFKKHFNIHKEYCDLQKGYTRDHDKFMRLWNEGSSLVSCIPGYSTHCEIEYMSPCVDWEKI